jgi:hypothetical protein
MWPTKRIFSSFKLDVSGVMLGVVASIYHAPLFLAITMANPIVWAIAIFQLATIFM